jgi:DNA-binding FrmR family transcriptional regulator
MRRCIGFTNREPAEGLPGQELLSSAGRAAALIPHQGIWKVRRPRDFAQVDGSGGDVKEEARVKVLARLRKVAGQVAGIQRMVEEDRYCVEVLHQVAAVEGALDRVGHLLLAAYVETCVASALESGKPRERKQKLDELMEVFSRFGRVRP